MGGAGVDVDVDVEDEDSASGKELGVDELGPDTDLCSEGGGRDEGAAEGESVWRKSRRLGSSSRVGSLLEFEVEGLALGSLAPQSQPMVPVANPVVEEGNLRGVSRCG